ncbi:SDR family NAD(P)-dependent oxidoreductase [Mycobacterium tilburgii]|uniref:SDR family NAD(P)-dependent oxidoreductase n=1 Tax=Mycobacterium tilburgii TaxID=44467 RepID=UPI0021B3BB2B|nr:SDR family NAD(P)-dependent oxidoreductase [Mycobacterium tilburgii]
MRRGDQVIATARKTDGLTDRLGGNAENALAVAADVTDPNSVTAALTEGLSRFGRIDVVMNNVGHELLGAVEEVSDAAVHGVRRQRV